MPRSRKRRPARPDAEDSLERLLSSWKRTETRRGADWTVQPVSSVQAQKEYSCPGCGRVIAPGTAHVVVWRADGVLGDAADLAARRHWHSHCWRIG
ncbi:hypothetical protein [Microbacterium hydrocarbonoxydans]|uniref:hypothetical protein n=1 Tax=Microbacterium hydrocarbonoxydans TaxID=273678 RepID=UPI00203DC1D7|nr:hypothetical protein [Microbacterium hydrocarbonoxydans]MCM3778966.1 hypothetical protein [Microbacterium hydrocarbonoxydans]